MNDDKDSTSLVTMLWEFRFRLRFVMSLPTFSVACMISTIATIENIVYDRKRTARKHMETIDKIMELITG